MTHLVEESVGSAPIGFVEFDVNASTRAIFVARYYGSEVIDQIPFLGVAERRLVVASSVD